MQDVVEETMCYGGAIVFFEDHAVHVHGFTKDLEADGNIIYRGTLVNADGGVSVVNTVTFKLEHIAAIRYKPVDDVHVQVFLEKA